MPVKVLITEDHELYRDGIRLLVLEALPGAEVLEAGDFAAAQSMLAEHPDAGLLLLDIHIPGTTGLNGLRTIKASHPAVPLVVVSTVDHHASIQQMLQLGADAFIAKTSSRSVMLNALQAIMDGEEVIISGQDPADAITLSPRQIATLELLALGLPNKEIALQLNISPSTVREYVSDLLMRFQFDNRTQAIVKARRLGFILD